MNKMIYIEQAILECLETVLPCDTIHFINANYYRKGFSFFYTKGGYEEYEKVINRFSLKVVKMFIQMTYKKYLEKRYVLKKCLSYNICEMEVVSSKQISKFAYEIFRGNYFFEDSKCDLGCSYQFVINEKHLTLVKSKLKLYSDPSCLPVYHDDNFMPVVRKKTILSI
jgi:hypothetical protein